MSLSYTITTQARLQRLFDTCIISETHYTEVDKNVKQILKGKDRYIAVSHTLNIPWYVTGIMHKTICDCDFRLHLHNGDPLNGRTITIPVGYPKTGRPPFSWEQSAKDVLVFYRFDKWKDWSIKGVLFTLEIVNRYIEDKSEKNLQLWRHSNHFAPENKEDQPCGGAILLRRMAERGLIANVESHGSRIGHIKSLGSEVKFMPNHALPKAYELQKLLNLSGMCVREDGKAGKLTAQAFYCLTSEYLNGDPDKL